MLAALARARATRSAGVDEVPMCVLKRVGPLLAPEIAALAHAVLREGWWPPQWKDAIVHPLYKGKGCRQDPTSYRPVALLPAIARLVERIWVDQVKGHVRAGDLLPPCQHGFRERHSCDTAVTSIVQLVATARDAGRVACVASLAAASAFAASRPRFSAGTATNTLFPQVAFCF